MIKENTSGLFLITTYDWKLNYDTLFVIILSYEGCFNNNKTDQNNIYRHRNFVNRERSFFYITEHLFSFRDIEYQQMEL